MCREPLVGSKKEQGRSGKASRTAEASQRFDCPCCSLPVLAPSWPVLNARQTNEIAIAMDLQLWSAVNSGSLQEVERALRMDGINVNAGSTGTALHEVCRFPRGNNTPEIIRLLLAAGADVDAKDFYGYTALMFSARFGDPGDARLLLDAGADVHATYQLGETALILAVARPGHAGAGHVDMQMVQLLLDSGADLEAEMSVDHGNLLYRKGWRALHFACSATFGRLEVVQELVGRRADMFAVDGHGNTPFDCACLAGNRTAVVNYLLQCYATTVVKHEGDLSVHSILRDATYLSAEGANVPLQVKLPLGKLTTGQIQTLMQKFDANWIHARDDQRALPLHAACRFKAPAKMLNFLLEQDPATIHYRDSHGAAPVHVACQSNAPVKEIQVLVEAGGVGTLCARDNRGAMPLHALCESGASIDAVKYLLKMYPASVKATTNDGAPPYMMACQAPAASLDVLQELLTAYPDALRRMQEYYRK